MPCYFSNRILTQFCKIYKWDRHHTPEKNKNSSSYFVLITIIPTSSPVPLSSASRSIATNKVIICRFRSRSCFFHLIVFTKSFTPPIMSSLKYSDLYTSLGRIGPYLLQKACPNVPHLPGQLGLSVQCSLHTFHFSTMNLHKQASYWLYHALSGLACIHYTHIVIEDMMIEQCRSNPRPHLPPPTFASLALSVVLDAHTLMDGWIVSFASACLLSGAAVRA